MIHLPWSYSSLSKFDQCKFSYKLRYIERLPEGPKSLQLERGIEAHTALDKYLRTGRGGVPPIANAFDAELHQMRKERYHSEVRWYFNDKWKLVAEMSGEGRYTGPPAWMVAITDAHKVKGKAGHVIDFKTGRIYEDKHVDQARLYATAMLACNPKMDEVTAEFMYLDKGLTYGIEVTRPEARRLQNGYERRVLEIDAEKKFTPNPTRLCGWCSYSKSKGGPCRAG